VDAGAHCQWPAAVLPEQLTAVCWHCVANWIGAIVVFVLLRATTCTIWTIFATVVIMFTPDVPPDGGDCDGGAPPDPGSPPEPESEPELGGFWLADEPPLSAVVESAEPLPLTAVAVPV
jgi:hypothetical protein